MSRVPNPAGTRALPPISTAAPPATEPTSWPPPGSAHSTVWRPTVPSAWGAKRTSGAGCTAAASATATPGAADWTILAPPSRLPNTPRVPPTAAPLHTIMPTAPRTMPPMRPPANPLRPPRPLVPFPFPIHSVCAAIPYTSPCGPRRVRSSTGRLAHVFCIVANTRSNVKTLSAFGGCAGIWAGIWAGRPPVSGSSPAAAAPGW